jgi:hypothetical protein
LIGAFNLHVHESQLGDAVEKHPNLEGMLAGLAGLRGLDFLLTLKLGKGYRLQPRGSTIWRVDSRQSGDPG